jgi:hypothetical protein
MSGDDFEAIPGSYEYLENQIETDVVGGEPATDRKEHWAAHLSGKNLQFAEDIQSSLGLSAADTMRVMVLLARSQLSSTSADGGVAELGETLEDIDERLAKIERMMGVPIDEPAGDGQGEPAATDGESEPDLHDHL